MGQICGTGPDGCESRSSCQSSVRQNLRWSLVSVRRIKAVIYMTLENIKIPWLWFNGCLSVSVAAFGCVNDTLRKERVFYDPTKKIWSHFFIFPRYKTALWSDQELNKGPQWSCFVHGATMALLMSKYNIEIHAKLLILGEGGDGGGVTGEKHWRQFETPFQHL